MRELATLNVEVGILPSHSSSVTQPLDLCPNAQFKFALGKSKPIFPSTTKMKGELRLFVNQLHDAAEFALLRPNVKKGWEKCGLIWGNMEDKLRSLDFRPPSYTSSESRGRFTISGQWITSSKFLEGWSRHESRRPYRHERRKQKRMKEKEHHVFIRKRRRIEKDDEYIEDDLKMDGEKERTLNEKKKKIRIADNSESSEDTTTDSEIRDEETPLNPITILEEKEESEKVELFSPSELQELRIRILEERLVHPHTRNRKPIRPFSPDPILRKTKRCRKDLEEEVKRKERVCNDDDVDETSTLDEDEREQLDILNFERDEEDENFSQDSEYTD
jgi:hypothetical protein